MTKQILSSVQVILSVALIVLVLMQARGTGFGRGSAASTSFTRRGLEKFVFKATFAVVGLFLAVSIFLLFA